jgi:hypothetical protein
MRNVARLAALAAAVLATSPATGALPPKYQRLAEIRAVLDNRAVSEALGDSPIDSIVYVRTDLYRVAAGRCRIDARIVGLSMPDGVVGARRFEVRAGQRICAR